VRTRPGLHQEQFEVEALDQGASVSVRLPWLETREERAAAEAARRAAAAAAAAATEAREIAEMAEPEPVDDVAAAEETIAPALVALEASPLALPEAVDGEGEGSILPRLRNSEDS
jgi:hypothetical protein